MAYYEIKVKDSNGSVTTANAKHEGSTESLRQIFIQQQKLGNMPVGEIVSIETTANPKLPTGTARVAHRDEKGTISARDVPVTAILGVGNKKKPE